MDYFTASEMAKLWSISSRMVAYYCEDGRIAGAVKKGKVWLIPADAEKPADRRCSRQKRQNGDDTSAEPYDGNDTADDTVYNTSDVYHSLGLTRETLRYYEKIGLISPGRSESSQYREFDLYDMSRLLAIDFFRKRGFNAAEIRELPETTEPEKYSAAIQEKINNVRENMEGLHEILVKLQKARDFLHTLEALPEFTVRDLPPYYIREAIRATTAFHEYKDKILSALNTQKDDILSHMVRAMTFDDSGYLSSEVYIVRPGTEGNHFRQERLLDRGRCLHTTLTVDSVDTSVSNKMFVLCREWARQHNLSFRGVVYIFTRFVMLHGQTERYCHEIWVPLRD